MGSDQTRFPWGQQPTGFCPSWLVPILQPDYLPMLFQKAFSFPDVEGLYLLTDGKPDTSCSLILSEVQRLQENRDVKVHTISLSCSDRAAANFLRRLASLTGGRYHCPAGEDTLVRIHGLLTKGSVDEKDPTLPLFEGDDLRRLAQEIAKARSFLWQAQSFRSQLQKKTNTEPKVALF